MSKLKHIIAKVTPVSLKRRLKASKFKRMLLKNEGRTQEISHQLKQAYIHSYQEKYRIRTFVETGTFLGEMVSAMRYFFSSIHSIELSSNLARDAQSKFTNFKYVCIIEGDSAIEMNSVLSRITGPVLFWLDGHYSGGNTAKGKTECPIWGELAAIKDFKNKSQSVILIDDVRLFDGTGDYPTMDALEQWISLNLPDHSFEIKFDILAIKPNR